MLLQRAVLMIELLGVTLAGFAQQRYSPPSPRVTPGTVEIPNMFVPGPVSSLSTTSTAAAVQIGSGDLLEIAVFDSPELAGRVRVSSDGNITLPLIGKLRVGGLSPEQAQGLVATQLKERNFVKDPQVSVFVTEYATQVVYVLGEVMRPGPYPLMGSHRFLDFISAAGGFTSRAGRAVTITTRADPDHPRTLEAGRLAKDSNPELAAGDSVLVSQAGIVYVLGDVVRPGGFFLNKDVALTVLQALALAEGTLPTAAKSSAMLIRTTAKGREEIPIDLKKIMRSKSIDLAMLDNDILFVPGSMSKGIWKGMQSIFPAAAAASVYRLP